MSLTDLQLQTPLIVNAFRFANGSCLFGDLQHILAHLPLLDVALVVHWANHIELHTIENKEVRAPNEGGQQKKENGSLVQTKHCHHRAPYT
jgi:hypothetical protein